MAIGIRCNAAKLQKEWELRLSDLPESKIVEPNPFVDALSFLPDGRHLAAIVNNTSTKRPAARSLIIVDLLNPRTGARSFTLDGPSTIEDESFPLTMSWSQTGDMVATPAVLQIKSGSECVLSHTLRAVFFDADRILSVQPGFPRSTAQIFDSTCDAKGMWELKGTWRLSDASMDRHLIAMSNDIPNQTEILVANPGTKEIVRRWRLQDVAGAWPLFADRGKVVCAIDGTGRRGIVHCWDVESGKEIAKTAHGNPHWPMKISLHAKRAILSDYEWKLYAEGWTTETGSLKRRVVWDFGTEKELASWTPRMQLPRNETSKMRDAFKFAISPDGESVAEGGDGILIFYHLN